MNDASISPSSKRRGIKSYIVYGLVALVAILIALVGFGAFSTAIHNRRLTRESIQHFIFGPNVVTHAEVETIEDLNRIRRFVRYTYLYKDIEPPKTLQGIFTRENLEQFSQDGYRIKRRLRAGIDPWGSPYFYEVRSHLGRDGTKAYTVVIRSPGPNQRDEGGKCDDREIEAY